MAWSDQHPEPTDDADPSLRYVLWVWLFTLLGCAALLWLATRGL